MSADPLLRLPSAVGNVLVRIRHVRNWSAEALANASGLSLLEIRSIEAGQQIPTLQGFFRIAAGLGESPLILLTEVISAWRMDPSEYGLYKARPSDFDRLYRLGYFLDLADFRELSRAYDSIDQAVKGARNIQGKQRVDLITTYIRVGYVHVDSTPEQSEGPSHA